MKKEEFVKLMSAICEMIEHIQHSDKTLSEVYGCDIFSEKQYLILDNITNSISDIFKDESGWVGYWLYELEMGKKYKPGMIKEKGKNVKLKTIEDLFNIINV